MNNKEILSIITNLASKRAPSGLEKARAEVFKEELDKILEKKDIPVEKDPLGNYFIKLRGKSAKGSIAILAHVDEIGGTIRKITKKGSLEFSRRGAMKGDGSFLKR